MLKIKAKDKDGYTNIRLKIRSTSFSEILFSIAKLINVLSDIGLTDDKIMECIKETRENMKGDD